MSDSVLARPFEDFVESLLPLYSGPQVTVRIAPANREYKLSKALLCEHSPIFKATFEGSFREGEEQATTLNEEDGVVSVRSFELLVQWMCQGQVIFGDIDGTESITMAIEFARISDMYGVTGMEIRMAEHIKALILASASSPWIFSYEFDWNTYLIDPAHIISAVQLPGGHPVRQILAAASVRGYFRDGEHKFVKEAQETPGFASDLLQAVKGALNTLKKGDYKASVADPLSGQEFYLI